ncbi:MAG: hypothetical protein A2338_00870, partial [Bacteroidetes bacterium RIFOXYB12_FULL_41_6]
MESKIRISRDAENLETRLSKFSIENIRATVPWLKFISFMGFIASGFIFIAAFFTLGASGIIKKMDEAWEIGVITFAIYIIISFLTFFPSKYLLNYAGLLKGFVQSNDNSLIERALFMQRKYWTFIGIISIIYFLM